ncbi:Senecionine N-oxygenase [Acropora cervicornis]|uniref:Flavin-containing monooxygenase n=1 Tax=Acropora cervicornis TaxID=6130 RepID=A0AAD9V933_ACRCE|nr:Senecionine N-oxygenase [Acropora cervicornis]
MWTSKLIQAFNRSEMLLGKRVCVIGAGPSGMSVLYHFNKLRKQDKDIPEVVCFEKQSNWGGLWKYSEETGTDRYGEPVHGSMYRGLWSNGPKEGIEYPDFSFDEHFGKPIPSFPPREAIYDYLKGEYFSRNPATIYGVADFARGRWTKNKLRHWIRFNHVVRQVTFNDTTNDFSVVIKNLPENKVLPVERFDFVVVANGHFSVPNMPFFPGVDQFLGRVIHSHDFRNASHFKGKRVLVVGAGLSAEDIALQCLKYGAKYIICTWRSKPMGYNWPSQITEKPLLTKIEGNTVLFRDGTSAEVDDIIFCTGYLHSYPFLEKRLQLKNTNGPCPEGLYKGLLWTRGGNNKVLVQNLNCPDQKIAFWTDYVTDISKEAEYGYNLDASSVFYPWVKHRMADITNYRSHSFTNLFTGKKSPVTKTPFMQEFDDSVHHFVNPEQRNGAISQDDNQLIGFGS